MIKEYSNELSETISYYFPVFMFLCFIIYYYILYQYDFSLQKITYKCFKNDKRVLRRIV